LARISTGVNSFGRRPINLSSAFTARPSFSHSGLVLVNGDEVRASSVQVHAAAERELAVGRVGVRDISVVVIAIGEHDQNLLFGRLPLRKPLERRGDPSASASDEIQHHRCEAPLIRRQDETLGRLVQLVVITQRIA
jgi:hypothetical protein